MVDWATMIGYVKQNLMKEPEYVTSTGVKLTELQRFQLGLNKILGYAWPQKNYCLVTTIEDKQHVVDFYIGYIIHVAQLIVCSENIMKLSLDDRVS